MKVKITDLEDLLTTPSLDKQNIVNSYIKGIINILGHSQNEILFQGLALKMLFTLKELVYLLENITLKPKVVITDNDLIIQSDKASNILKIAKTLLEPSDFNIKMVERLFQDIKETENLYSEKEFKTSYNLKLIKTDFENIEYKYEYVEKPQEESINTDLVGDMDELAGKDESKLTDSYFDENIIKKLENMKAILEEKTVVNDDSEKTINNNEIESFNNENENLLVNDTSEKNDENLIENDENSFNEHVKFFAVNKLKPIPTADKLTPFDLKKKE